MSNKVLFVFEGEKTEKQIISNLQTFFLDARTTVKCVYGAEIYQIYKDIKDDDDLDTFNFIREQTTKNKEVLDGLNRSDFAEIYMFFDYDGHSSLADDSKLKELLEFFNEETEKGKLYVSYPMVEALKHICDYSTFKDLTVECKKNIGYKNIVHNSAINELKSFNKYELNTWKTLITVHLKKANFIINNTYAFPNELLSQILTFSKQLEKYINPNSIIAVLSAFPLFLHDYYGNEEIKRRLE
ncbi:MAG: hypothetical protein GX793_04915 [Bacteroidales bacterium]|jgi:hypothetical protein|nr:hypothetical protein [Bacteroidales bacterium]NLB86383.1 hypothetical protein [Bacteroidales bacterium]